MDAFHSKSVQLVSSISSDENLTESCNGFILKKNFTKAVNLSCHRALVDFAWGSEMLAEKIPLKEFKLKEQEEIFQIPVTLSNISTLTQKPQCRSLKNSWVIDASQVYCSTAEDLDITSLVAHNLQLPKEMEIKAKFSSLILYNAGNGFTHSLGTSFVEGKFGAAILQVPVEGGHKGGNLNVDYEGRKKRFESHERSDAVFYLTAFYDSCENSIEPISRGFKLVLVYDLLWTNSTNEIPRNLPVFLEASKQIKESLRPWSNRYQLSLKSPQNLVEEMKEPTGAASVVHADDPIEPIKSFQNEANVPFVEKTIQENVFFFVLQENYEEKTLSFLFLQGHDRVFADVLLNCDFLDVHLAMATQSSFQVHQGKVEAIEISRLIDADDITRNLSIKLTWDKNFAGLIPSYPKKKLEEDNSEDSIADAKKNLHRGVLLIWPKYLSVQMYCRYGLHSLLVRIGTSLKSTCIEAVRTKVLPDLRQLISYCCAEPRKVWTKSGMKKGELTQRLLDFCIFLRAREEGLHLLKNLALNFDEDSLDTEDFEGIQTEDVALAIAKFEHRVCGWNVIAETIRALVKPDRIAKQLVPITKLAKHFLRFHCFDGAKTVGDCISSFFAEMDPSLAWQSKCFDVEAVIDMLVALESHPETSSRKRVKSFALFFSNLRPSLQCHLLQDFESQHGFRLKTIPSWQFVYQDLCAVFSESSNSSPPPLSCMTVDFMNGIQVWLSKLREEAKLRELVEPNVDVTDPVLEHMSAISSSPKSFGSICSTLDPDFKLRDFEMAYAEISASEVSADQPPAYGRATNSLGIWVRNPQAAPAVDISTSTSDQSFLQLLYEESDESIPSSPLSKRQKFDDRNNSNNTSTSEVGLNFTGSSPSSECYSASAEKNISLIDKHSSDNSLAWSVPCFTSTPNEETRTSNNMSGHHPFEFSEQGVSEYPAGTDKEINFHQPDCNVQPSDCRCTNVSWIAALPREVKSVRLGKWTISLSNKIVNKIWGKVRNLLADNQLGNGAKVTRVTNTYLLMCLYTYDFEDDEDVFRVLVSIRRNHLSGGFLHYQTADQAAQSAGLRSALKKDPGEKFSMYSSSPPTDKDVVQLFLNNFEPDDKKGLIAEMRQDIGDGDLKPIFYNSTKV